ncbi:glycosyltransferase [Variovorax paradoxus]|nr:glycosyltransferase [Variovorax paradoxus]
MFLAPEIEPVQYTPPWSDPLANRIAALCAKRSRVAWIYGQPDTSTFRYRVANLVRAVNSDAAASFSAGWFSLDELPRLLPYISSLDAIVLARVRYGSCVAHLIALARERGVELIFDCDDLVFDTRYVNLLIESLDLNASQEVTWDNWFAYVGRMEATARQCNRGITTNSYIAERLREVMGGRPIHIVPNYLDRNQQLVSQRLFDAKVASAWARDASVTIGYFSGSPTHNRDFAIAAPALARLLKRDPKVNLRVVGFLDLSGPLATYANRIEVLPLQNYINLQHSIATVEINIAPLQNNVFTNCKSELKFFEAAAVGSWTIATPTFAFKSSIVDGQTGRLAQTHEWDAALDEAVNMVRDHKALESCALDAARQANANYDWLGVWSQEISKAVLRRL